MKPWPHTIVTFASSGEVPGHKTRSVLVNGSPVTVALGGVEVSQPTSDEAQTVKLTLLPDEIHFIQGGAPASTETARNGGLSDDRAEQAPTDPPTRERASQSDPDEALAALIEPLLPAMPDQVSSLLSLKIARAARKHIFEEQAAARYEERITQVKSEYHDYTQRAEKAEAERDALRERLDALRADVDSLRRNPENLTDVLLRAADALRRDDERAAKGERS